MDQDGKIQCEKNIEKEKIQNKVMRYNEVQPLENGLISTTSYNVVVFQQHQILILISKYQELCIQC